MASTFKDLLIAELQERQKRNSSYSLRAFARFLGMDHSRLSKILRGERPVSWGLARQLGPILGLTAEEIEKIGATPTKERPGKAQFSASISLQGLNPQLAATEIQRLLLEWASSQNAQGTQGPVTLNL